MWLWELDFLHMKSLMLFLDFTMQVQLAKNTPKTWKMAEPFGGFWSNPPWTVISSPWSRLGLLHLPRFVQHSYINWTENFLVGVKHLQICQLWLNRKRANCSTALGLSNIIGGGGISLPCVTLNCARGKSKKWVWDSLLLVLLHSKSQSLSGPTLNLARCECGEPLSVLW